MVRMPLGNFSRSRKDWQLETLRYGSQVDTGTTSTLASIYSLNNNANDGTYLALWGILGWYGSARGMMIANTVFGQVGGFAGTPVQLNPTAPACPGLNTLNRNTNNGEPIVGVAFTADGATWFSNGDIPLFLIPPNWRVDCLPFEPIGNFSTGAPSSITFLWGPYGAAKMNKLSARGK